MRHAIRTTVALFCVLVQLALGASSALGLVLCVGRDHSGIELSSDGCCVAHEMTHHAGAESTLDEGCCSDIPLVSATRQASSGPRSEAAPPLVALPSPLPDVRIGGRRAADPASPPPARLALSSIVLRV